MNSTQKIYEYWKKEKSEDEKFLIARLNWNLPEFKKQPKVFQLTGHMKV